MSDSVDSGGFDSTSGSDKGGGDSGDSVDISGGSAEVEISAANVEVSIEDGTASTFDNAEVKSVDITDHSSKTVDISGAPEHAEFNIEIIPADKTVDSMISNLNGAIEGIKANNESTEAEKSEAIRANVNDTLKNIGMSDMSPEEKVEAMNKVFNNLPEGAKKDIYVPAYARYLKGENSFNDEGEPSYLWEGNMGFDGKPEKCSLSVGQTVDRYGSESGSYVCEVKNGVPVDYESRQLPYAENPEMYHQYEITKNMDDFKSRIENLTVEEIEQIEIQRDLNKPEGERRSAEQIKEDAADRYTAIIFDAEKNNLEMYNAAKRNGWQNEYMNAELSPMKGKIKPAFQTDGENSAESGKDAAEQICLPASVDTLVYLGYMKEKE